MATTAIGGEWVGAIASAPRVGALERADSQLIEALCSAVREYLERRVDLLNEEVRRYPRPIARCDDQLTGLLEERASAAAQLQRLSSLADQDRSRIDGLAFAGGLIDLLLNRR